VLIGVYLHRRKRGPRKSAWTPSFLNICSKQDEVSGDGEGCGAVNGLVTELDLERRSWDFVVLHVWDDELVWACDEELINILSRQGSSASFGSCKDILYA